jgi:hypothetical protein
VEIVILVAALVASFGIGLGVSRFVLGFVFARMAGDRTVGVTLHWRRIAFAAGLFWLWYLVPTLAAAATAPSGLLRQLLGN